MSTAASQHVGRVVQVIGPVVDVEFEDGYLPPIYNALRIESGGAGTLKLDIVAEVEQHLGESRVRAVAMKATDGLQRGMPATDLGEPICMPVGPKTLGRVLNVLGEPVDFPDKPVGAAESWPIHRPAPSLEDQSTELQMFETGIKVVDLLEPYLRGGSIGLFGGVASARRHHPGGSSQHRPEARRRVRVRRGGRAHPRGQRPLDRDAGERRHQGRGSGTLTRGPGLRPDDRAARRPPACGAERPHRGGVPPGRRGQGRAPLHRQHLPVHPGRLRGFGAARADAVGRRYQPTLSTEIGELQERITSTKKGAITSVQAIYVPADDYTDPAPATTLRTWTRRRTCRARSSSSASTRPLIRSRRPRGSSTRASSATSTTRSPAR